MYIDTKGKVDYTYNIEQPIAQLQTEKLKFEKRDREEKIMKKKVLSALLAATMVVSMTALAAQSEFADQQIVGNNYWTPAESLGQNLVDGAKDVQKVLDDAVAGITQPVSE